MYKPTLNSYFSGAGLLDIGLMKTGIEIQQSYEIDKDAVKVQEHNLDHEVIQSDLAFKLVEDENHADVIAFTYPCTNYSTIGDIHGGRTGDDLYLHALRHMAARLLEAVQRDMWEPDEETLERIQSIYLDVEGLLE